MPLIKTTKKFWVYVALAAVGYILWAGGVLVGQPARAAGPIFDNSATVPYDFISGDTIFNTGSWYSANENITRLSIPVKNVGSTSCHLVWDSRLSYGVGLYKEATVTADIAAGQVIAATFNYPSSPSITPSSITGWTKYRIRTGDTCGSNAQAGRIYTVDETDTLYYTGPTNRVAAAIVNGGDYPVEEPDPKEEPTSYITKPTIGQTYTAGSTVGFVVATDIELGTASSPIDYQFKLEQYVNSSWVAATVAAYNGDISTTGQWTYRDPNATEYVNYTPPGGTPGDYYGYGGGLRTVNISRLDGQYRISGRVAFTGNGYTYGPWSDTVLFGVGTSGYGPVINPDGSTAGSDSIGPPQWEGIGSLGSFIWDWVSYLLFPTADQFSGKVTDLVATLGSKWPFSWFTDTVGALIGSLLDSTTPECVANEPNLFLGPWPNACWFAASFRSLYGTWAEPAAAAGVWLWAAHEVWQTGKALLGLESAEDVDKSS